MNKLTKIVATIGPVTESEEMMEQLITAGVNIIRFNLKHNNIAWHTERIQRANKVAQKMGKTIGILVDLQGPEVRLIMPVDQIEVNKGDLLLVGAEAMDGKEKGFTISHLDIIPFLTEGQRVVADDGAFVFHVVKKGGKTYVQSESIGILKTRKTLNIPGSDFPLPVLVDRDFEALGMAASQEADYVALSFVRTGADMKAIREEMKKYNVKAKLIAKIETQQALNNLDEIIALSDGVMVARGDLAVEAAIEEVPYWQKIMIKKCMDQGKCVITATQMLLSMTKNPSPTRAEVSDVANAIYDQTDCVMLSEESAAGSYPIKAVEMMSRIAAFHESKKLTSDHKVFDFSIDDTAAMVCDAAYELYYEYMRSKQNIAGFLVFTQTGRTAQLISRYRVKVPVFAFTPDKNTSEGLTGFFGVMPSVHDVAGAKEVTREEIEKVIANLEKEKMVEKGSKLIVLHGDTWGIKGGTSTVRIVEV